MADRTLPLEQPRRALTVLGWWLAAVAAVLLLSVRTFDGPLVPLVTGAVAVFLLVPVLVLAPLPRPEPAGNATPVLERPRRTDRPRSTAPVASPRDPADRQD